jgi:hypothetical protein
MQGAWQGRQRRVGALDPAPFQTDRRRLEADRERGADAAHLRGARPEPAALHRKRSYLALEPHRLRVGTAGHALGTVLLWLQADICDLNWSALTCRLSPPVEGPELTDAASQCTWEPTNRLLRIGIPRVGERQI